MEIKKKGEEEGEERPPSLLPLFARIKCPERRRRRSSETRMINHSDYETYCLTTTIQAISYIYCTCL